MTANSMTGFARCEGNCGDVNWFWEIRSVNGKGLDIRMRLGAGYETLEKTVRELLRSAISRGSVQVSLNVTRTNDASRIRINEDAVRDLLAAATDISERYKLQPPSLDGLLGIRGIVELVEPEEDENSQKCLEAMAESFADAVSELKGARIAEGKRMEAVIEGQLVRIAKCSQEAARAPSRSPENIKAKLTEQVTRLMQGPGDFDEARLHQEAALLAAKVDIQEELDRLDAHVEAARELLSKNEPVGRKLDFLAQEFNREANTLCSKSNHVDLTAIGLELKVVVDQLREQVQNIE